MNKNTRIFMGIGIGIIIVFMIIVLILNWNKAFTAEAVVTYPDGCVEKFVNGELITPECVEGRMLEQMEADGIKEWNPMIT